MVKSHSADMVSSTDAEAHIARLRHQLEPHCHPRLASLMTNAVDLFPRVRIVSQLYDRATHFILEFLQNLDDTAYEDSVTPAVKFTYRSGRLRVDSNQIGFSSKDIDAICAIGSSTKVNQPQHIQSVGEKGIGFKSVFRVAHKVWLSSRDYSIKWDRAAKLGAMAPEWARFPEHVAEGQTSFLCELDQGEQQEEILSHLAHFDVSLILFLKKLGCVDIEVHRDDGQHYTKSVTRRDIESGESQVSVLRNGNDEIHYLASSLPVIDLPKEPRRCGSSSSELVLAFPLRLEPSTAPTAVTQNVYSGLPIGNHGLRFLLNADFILTASRQTIDISLPWNVALRDALPLALVNAVDQLIDTPCKYTWPWFATAAAPSAFFEPAFRSARQALQSKPILESCDGQLRLSTELVYVDPTLFAGGDGCPMTLYRGTNDRYLSLSYPEWTIDSILDLGVRYLTYKEFLRDLQHMITDDPEGFYGQPSKWHEDLATVLLPQVDVPELETTIRKLRIIPLLDGNWTDSELPKGRRAPRPVFWPSNIDLHGSEAKLPFCIVNSSLLLGVQRRKLFERLCITTLDPQRICNGIVAAHIPNGPGSFSDPAVIGDAALFSHALLLFQESWISRSHQPPELWFASGDGRRRRGSELYIASEAGNFSRTNNFHDILRTLSPKLHLGYFQPKILIHSSPRAPPDPGVSASDRHKDFVNYLDRTFRLLTVPRLVESNTPDSCDFSLSKDFRDLFEKFPASHILQLILDKWEFYSLWIELDELHKHCEECINSRAILLRNIADLPSTVEHGPHAKVMDTVLPDVDSLIQDGIVALPVLQIFDSQDEAVRHRSQYLGVTTRRGAAFYLKCLEAISRQSTPSEQHVAYLYEQIQGYYAYDKDEIEHSFLNQPLIFVSGRPLTAGQTFCEWTTIPNCVKMGLRLENVYPRSAQFFRTLQAADGLGMHELMNGILLLSANPTESLVPSLVESLRQLSKATAAMSRIGATRKLAPLKSARIFPITTGDPSLSPQMLSSEHRGWYIADRPYLRDSFIEKVALLDVSSSDADQMEDLLGCLGLNSRKMSICVTTRTHPKGPIKLRASDTKLLQSRAPFFEALTPSANVRKRTISHYIRTATVSSATDIIDNHELQGIDTLQGRDTRSQVVWQVEGDELTLNFIEERGLTEDSFWRYASSAMSLPGPFDFRDPISGCPDGDSTNHDLLQTFHGMENRQFQGDYVSKPEDRRLDLMRHHCENDPDDKARQCYATLGKRLDSNSNLKFLGEQLLSLLFRRELGKSYDPVVCWTSRLRTMAGLPEFPSNTHHASFTMSDPDMAKMVTKFLYKRGWQSLAQHDRGPPIYHFDVGVSVGGLDDTFEWGTSQLRMAHEYRHVKPLVAEHPLQNNMLVLVRITDAYTEPKFSLILDPWSHFNSGLLQLQLDVILPAALQMGNRKRNHDSPNHVTGSVSMPDTEVHMTTTGECSSNTVSPRYVSDKEGIFPFNSSTPRSAQLTEDESSPSQYQTQDYVTGSYGKGVPHVAGGHKRKRNPEPEASGPEMRPPAAKRTGTIAGLHHTYQYTKIADDEIRLFTLFPGNGTERMQGMIWTTTSQRAGPYETLSYVWGPEQQPMHVLRTPSGDLRIKNALYTALVNLRSKREPLTLWIDALCINQGDSSEKIQQIALLPETFQRSSCTLAFIGGEGEHHEAIQMLMQVRARMVLGPSSKEWPEDLPRCPLLWEERGMPYPEDPMWARVAALFSNAWFRRAWIVQEAVIARRLKLVFGKTRVDWNHLFLVMDHIDKELEATESSESYSWVPFLKLGRLRHIEDRSGRVSILKLLENFRHARSTDPRDKLFSLIRIASDGNLEDFTPDYVSPIAEVIQRFAVALIRRFAAEKQAMLLLYRAGLSQSYDLPSWIPDWLEEKPDGLHDALGRGNAFNACGDVQERISYVSATGELEVDAYLIDEVEYVTSSCNGSESSEQQSYFKEVEDLLEGVFGDIWDTDQLERVLWEAPIAGAKHPKISQAGDQSIQDSWEAFRQLLKLDQQDQGNEDHILKRLVADPQGEDKGILETKSRVYQSLLADVVRDWRFVILKERNLCGIAPNIVQDGDVVHIFHGGVVPFITRRSGEKEGAYKLVGQCYIWGMMQGEGASYDELVQETVRLH